LINYETPDPPYIVIKSLEFKKITLLTLRNDSPISVGRKTTAGLHIDEESISRNHAEIYCERRLANKSDELRVYVKDLSSKYGTLVLVKNDIELVSERPLWFQSENCVFMVNLEHHRLQRLHKTEIRREQARENKEKLNKSYCAKLL